MSGAQHTPGPWEAVEATEHHGFYVTSNVGNTVCDLYTMSQPALPSTANGGPSKPVPFMHEMDGPNARLIAAAPELYQSLMDIMEDPEIFTSLGGNPSVVEGVMARAFSALEKARGEAA